MRRFDLRSGETSLSELSRLFSSRADDLSASAEGVVKSILADVRTRGDEAVLDYTRRFDFETASALRVPDSAIDAATARIEQTALWPALHAAAARIRSFHEKQLRQTWLDTSRAGELLGQQIAPLRRVGLYVPGGRAAYPSTVLMIGVPAAVAGVPSIALATPPTAETGLPPDATLAAARVAGIHEVYAMGGAQAVGAFAYGTESVARVDTIAGPGNVFVNVAKRLVFGSVGIDMLAGPSEVALLCDETADVATAAADLIAQTEHAPDNNALIATPSEAWLDAVLAEVARQLVDLPRAELVERSLENSFAVLTNDLAEAVTVVNLYAPEHLHLACAEPWGLLPTIHSAGAILIGDHSSASIGDYVAGPSHTLPTAGCARFASPLNVDTFLKKTSLIYLNQEAARAIGPVAETFGTFEGLEGHARAARR